MAEKESPPDNNDDVGVQKPARRKKEEKQNEPVPAGLGVDVKILLIPVLLGIVGALYTAYMFRQVEPSFPFGKNLAKPVDPARESKLPDGILPENEANVSWRKKLEAGGYGKKGLQESQIAYKPGGKLYLVIAGHVFDVTEGEKMYGEGSSYHGFIGQDCTRAFITGKFDAEGCSSDVSDLEDDSIGEISKWLTFYFDHKTYVFKGVIAGRYFDPKGKPTQEMMDLIGRMKEAEKNAQEKAAIEGIFPPCNMEWTAASGSRLWCTQRSGGIDRGWVGFPRQFTEDGKETRCACVNNDLLNDPRVKLYPGCAPDDEVCKLE